MDHLKFHLGQLRHLYWQMSTGRIKNTEEAAKGLLSPAVTCFEGIDNELFWLKDTLTKTVQDKQKLDIEIENLIHKCNKMGNYDFMMLKKVLKMLDKTDGGCCLICFKHVHEPDCLMKIAMDGLREVSQ